MKKNGRDSLPKSLWLFPAPLGLACLLASLTAGLFWAYPRFLDAGLALWLLLPPLLSLPVFLWLEGKWEIRAFFPKFFAYLLPLPLFLGLFVYVYCTRSLSFSTVLLLVGSGEGILFSGGVLLLRGLYAFFDFFCFGKRRKGPENRQNTAKENKTRR